MTLTEPEMNQNAARALQRLLSFRLGSQGFPRPRAVSATGYRGLAGLTLPALLLPAAPPADPPEQTCTAWAAEAPEAVPRGLGRAGRRQHPAPGRPRAPEPLPRTGLRGCGKLGPGGPRGEVGGGEKAESSPEAVVGGGAPLEAGTQAPPPASLAPLDPNGRKTGCSESGLGRGDVVGRLLYHFSWVPSPMLRANVKKTVIIAGFY